MEKTVTLRFYDVTRTSDDRPALADLIQLVANLPLDQRQKFIGEEEILVRLENFQTEGNDICGQFIRGQSGNRPGRMLASGTDDLPFVEPLGHGIAFRYRTTNGLLAIEYNPFILSPSRVISYLYEFDAYAEYLIDPRLRTDAWQEFETRPLRKLTVGIASHPDVTLADDPNSAVWNNVGNMKDLYGAEYIKIEIGMGHHKGALSAAAKSFVRDAFHRHEEGTEDIRTIKGVVERGEGVKNEEIDLMGELFDAKVDLHFPGDDFAQFYTLRQNELRTRIGLL